MVNNIHHALSVPKKRISKQDEFLPVPSTSYRRILSTIVPSKETRCDRRRERIRRNASCLLERRKVILAVLNYSCKLLSFIIKYRIIFYNFFSEIFILSFTIDGNSALQNDEINKERDSEQQISRGPGRDTNRKHRLGDVSETREG